jgi:DNA polymerase I
MPDLRNRLNEPTGAIQGVLNMLRRLHKEYPSDYSACIFDAKGKTFRDDIYPDYKANRASMPEDLKLQIEPLMQTIEAMGWPLIVEEGVEADDVIGTLSKLAQNENLRVIISTGDKDIAQLVNERVTLVNTMSNEKLDIAGVIEKFGVQPDRMIDYLTLIGDTSDNVPGVEKVGPKTAVKWLNEYGSLDNIISHATEIGGVVGDNLRRALDWIPTAKDLISIRCDLKLKHGLEDLQPKPANKEKLAQLFDHFEFKSWRRELDHLPDQTATPSSPSLIETNDLFGDYSATPLTPRSAVVVNTQRNYETVLTQAQLAEWIEKIKLCKLVCIDTETTGLDPMQSSIVGISISIEAGEACYIPLMHEALDSLAQLSLSSTLAQLKPILENPDIKKLGQNLKFDQHIFANHGIDLKGIQHDTLLESYVFESHQRHNMDDLAIRHLGITPISYESLTGKGVKQIPFSQVPIEQAAIYAAEDADITLQLHQTMFPIVQADPKLAYIYGQIEMPCREVLFTMERNGVLIDSGMLNRQSNEIGLRILELEQEAYTIAGQEFNLASPKQLQEILFGKLGIQPTKKTPKGAPSTDEDVLQELSLDYPLPKVLLDHRGLSKLKSTYTDKLPKMINPKTGRIHTSYNQAVAITGRLASADPNLQNIPVKTAEGRKIREAFIASPNHVLVSADYSQIELRIMAHLSKDKGMLDAFANHEDIHRRTASEIFSCEPEAVSNEQRRYAKVINFGLIYGMSAFGLAQNLNIERQAAQNYIERYFSRYPGVKTYMQDTRSVAKQKGYVETFFGRRLWVPEINSSNGMRRAGAERAAINAPMQGTAADLIKLAMIAVQNWIASSELQTKLIMQVHDELVLEVPVQEVDIVKTKLAELMQNVAKLDVPLIVDIGTGNNWEAAH